MVNYLRVPSPNYATQIEPQWKAFVDVKVEMGLLASYYSATYPFVFRMDLRTDLEKELNLEPENKKRSANLVSGDILKSNEPLDAYIRDVAILSQHGERMVFMSYTGEKPLTRALIIQALHDSGAWKYWSDDPKGIWIRKAGWCKGTDGSWNLELGTYVSPHTDKQTERASFEGDWPMELEVIIYDDQKPYRWPYTDDDAAADGMSVEDEDEDEDEAEAEEMQDQEESENDEDQENRSADSDYED